MFQLAFEERSVLQTALYIAIRTWEERLADPRLSAVHEETRMQLAIGRNMQDRLDDY